MDTRATIVRWGMGVGVMAALGLGASCSQHVDTSDEPGLPGALVGEIETLVADYDDGHSDRQHFIDLEDGARTRLRLVFDGDGEPPAGSRRVAVWGQIDADTLHVTRIDPLVTPQPDPELQRSALTGVTPKPRTAAFVIVDVGGGSNITNDSANTKVFTPGSTFANVYSQLSYGILPFSGDVVGPLSYPMTTCDYSGLQRALKPMITGTYQHYMWYFGSRVSACSWGGIGSEGNVSRPQADAWYNASTGCTVLVQEVGHNLGWMHSSTLACSGATFADDPTSCTSNEYGNRMTPMGMGCGMLNAHDLWYWKLIDKCNGVKVTTSATFNLMPLETACNGIQAIQIPMIKTGRQAKPTQGSNQPLKNYYLEYRNKTGLDANITQAVYVYAGDDIHPSTRTSNWSWLLDMTPGGSTFEGLTAGGSFTDPTGEIKVTVMSMDAAKAVVQIDIQGGAGAPPTCMDGTTVEAPGSLDCASGGNIGGASGTAGTSGTGAGGRGGSSGAAGRAGTSGGGAGTSGGAGRGGNSGGGAGTTGAAGTTGTPGAAGTTAVAGRGGAPGSAGATAAGSAGTTGVGIAGTTGTGTGGAVVVTGTAGTTSTGAAGATVAGTAGSIGIGGGPPTTGAGGSSGLRPVTGGCACDVAPGGAGRPTGLLVLFGLAWARRRRKP